MRKYNATAVPKIIIPITLYFNSVFNIIKRYANANMDTNYTPCHTLPDTLYAYFMGGKNRRQKTEDSTTTETRKRRNGEPV